MPIVGSNVNIEVKDGIATITIDLTKRLGASKSGKNMVVATTNGNISVPEHEAIKLGINCYTK
jgi:hypothetical protein